MEIKYKNFSSNRAFGVELELHPNLTKLEIADVVEKNSNIPVVVTGWDISYGDNYWHLKEDSTCGPKGHITKDYGWELASFKASGYKDMLHIGKIATALKNANAQINTNCGLHIHVEIADFSPEEVAVLIANWCKIEQYMCHIVPKHRLKNKHCKLWSKSRKYSAKNAYEPLEFWNKIKPNNFSPYNNLQKKVSLNLVNYAYALHRNVSERKTVELRLPASTLNGGEIINWIRFFILFVETSKEKSMPNNLVKAKNIDEMLNLVGLNHKEDVFYIWSKGLYTTKKWLLDKLLDSDAFKCKTKPSDKKLHCEIKEKLSKIH